VSPSTAIGHPAFPEMGLRYSLKRAGFRRPRHERAWLRPPRTMGMGAAMLQIIVADVSMSLDNVP
jgi:predicted tellurium resistance membrane protein TerC